ncbi:MAG: hypothetical protein HY899_01505 [Deltaproteobacteria bacterium]|nr:hypothetical protein [Deltaproteobacteria bacterium]
MLAANPAMSGLYQQALAPGFPDLGVASERTLSDASTQRVIYMFEPAAFEHIQIVNAGGTVLALRFDPSPGVFSAFDLSVGAGELQEAGDHHSARPQPEDRAGRRSH